MHILFISDNFPPEVNAPASRTFEHCREWVRAGHQVTVITCAPNFPSGKVFSGYRNKLWQTEQMAGIRVIRVWTFIARNEGFLKRILDYVSFVPPAVFAASFVRKVDVIVGTSPQFFTAVAAYLAGTLKRVPWVFELRDIWPESIRAVGAMRQSLVLDLLEKLELFLYRRSAAVVSVTHAFKERLICRGIAADKIHVVTNGVDLSRFSPCVKDESLVRQLGLSGKFVAGYVGTHGLAHALETVVLAAAKLRDREGCQRFHFVFLGDGAAKPALMEQANRLYLDNVTFLDSVAKDEVVRYWSILDASIIHLKKEQLFSAVIPSKLFECMAMGIPVIHGVPGESTMIVKQECVGSTFDAEDADSLCLALNRLFEDERIYTQQKGNGPAAAQKYDRRTLAANMLCILKSVAEQD